MAIDNRQSSISPSTPLGADPERSRRVSNSVDVGLVLNEGTWGVYQRWLVFLTAVAVVFDGIDNQLLGIVIPTVMREWGVPRSDFAPVVSLGYAGMMLGGAAAGWPAIGSAGARRCWAAWSSSAWRRSPPPWPTGPADAGVRCGCSSASASAVRSQCGVARRGVRAAATSGPSPLRHHRVRPARRHDRGPAGHSRAAAARLAHALRLRRGGADRARP